MFLYKLIAFLLQENFLVIGGETRNIEVHDIQSERKVQSITGHENRYKPNR